MSARYSVAQRGATLVELVVSIVVISIGLAGVLIVMDRTTRSSGDALVEHQAIAVAEAYLEEILAKPFCDPDNAVPCATGNAPGSANCQVCPAAEGSRDLFDNVCDYNGLNNNPPEDQAGTVFAALAAYAAQVGVSTAGTLGTGGTQLSGASCEVLAVTVTVTGPAGTNVTLVGHRANY